MLKQLTSWNK